MAARRSRTSLLSSLSMNFGTGASFALSVRSFTLDALAQRVDVLQGIELSLSTSASVMRARTRVREGLAAASISSTCCRPARRSFYAPACVFRLARISTLRAASKPAITGRARPSSASVWAEAAPRPVTKRCASAPAAPACPDSRATSSAFCNAEHLRLDHLIFLRGRLRRGARDARDRRLGRGDHGASWPSAQLPAPPPGPCRAGRAPPAEGVVGGQSRPSVSVASPPSRARRRASSARRDLVVAARRRRCPQDHALICVRIASTSRFAAPASRCSWSATPSCAACRRASSPADSAFSFAPRCFGSVSASALARLSLRAARSLRSRVLTGSSTIAAMISTVPACARLRPVRVGRGGLRARAHRREGLAGARARSAPRADRERCRRRRTSSPRAPS